MKVSTAQQGLWLKEIIAGIVVLNVLDGVLTLLWVYSGRAVETNPLLAELVDTHPLAFMLAKLSLVILGVLLLWRLRRHPVAVITLFLAFLMYSFLLLYHLQAMNPGALHSLWEHFFGP